MAEEENARLRRELEDALARAAEERAGREEALARAAASDARAAATASVLCVADGRLGTVPDLRAFMAAYVRDVWPAAPDELDAAVAAALAEYVPSERSANESAEFSSHSSSSQRGLRFSAFRRHLEDDVVVKLVRSDVMSLLGGAVAGALGAGVADTLVADLELARSFLVVERARQRAVAEAAGASSSSAAVSEDSVVFYVAQWWLGQAAGAVADAWQVFDGRGAEVSVTVPVTDRTARSYTGKTDVFVGLGAASADADAAVEVELGLWFLAELKRPFDRLAGGGGSAKDQLLLEVAAYATSREASRAEEAPWRPMVGVVTDLFRVNVAFDLPDSAWDDGPWQLGLGTRVVTPAAEYVRVVLGALVLAYWDDVSEGVRAAASAEGAASVSAWVERLVADEDVDVFASEEGSSDDETEADDTTPRPRRALRSGAARSSAAPTAASSSASSSSHGSGARASQGSVEKRFQRVAATREALLEIVGNTVASR
ncbi:uncharacterized protein AMSG_02208 [Thecamonas trahens ATCC 50062]|uniref:Uncharacterized protein n=1 Tax=Thecamonas trahens ATCC 50062 TaxID=461836 RepID=A0A0L0DXH7_THETB|nr:hypothetical protein AMSG_02208 [Thecamonas trahens ATCC 50062]KNC56238.1 hypothetical protein AMSG_02208 [Thecamonas trahens ATCC 50062]|eukprot:XP_013760760.1 hypothetical protein AMSG_02208 [Thecamonas trahens ATCC 50062]